MRTLTHKINQRLASQTYERLLHIAHAQGLMKDGHFTDGGFDQVINHLLDRYQQTKVSTEQLFPLMRLTTEETDYVFDVIEKTNANIAEELRTGFLARIKTIAKAREQLSRIDLDNPEERQRRLGAGEKALEQIVARLMAENDAATHDQDKVYLSSGLLKAVARAGKTSVIQFQKNNRALFDTHHAKHGWRDAATGKRQNQVISHKFKTLMGDEACTDE